MKLGNNLHFVHVKVFNKVFKPHAPNKRSTNTKGIYRKHESSQKPSYEACIREIEHTSNDRDLQLEKS